MASEAAKAKGFSMYGDINSLPDAVMSEDRPKFQSVSDGQTAALLEAESKLGDTEVSEEELGGWMDKFEVKVKEMEGQRTSQRPSVGENDEGEDFDRESEMLSDQDTEVSSFWEDFFQDTDGVWEMWTDIRTFAHEIIYDYLIEKPNEVEKLRDIRTKLINKSISGGLGQQEGTALANINRYLDTFEGTRKEYFLKLKYHAFQEKWGKRYFELKLREMKAKGNLSEWMIVFAVFLLPEGMAAKRMYNSNKDSKTENFLANE